MAIKFAARMSRFQMSPSAATSQRARELRAAGHDIIALSSGEPDFQTPDHVIEAAAQAARAGHTKYTTTSGTAEIKAAVIEKFKRDNGLSYKSDEIIICNGAKQVLFNAIMATVEDGDEVIVGAPYWVAYGQMTQMAGGKTITVPTTEDSGFKLQPADLAAAITPRTIWLMLNSPGNPSGAVYTAKELEALAEVLRQHPHVNVMSDDIYEHILFDGRTFATLAQVAPDLKDRTLTINGASKAYAMTGWRIGYGGGPSELIREMTKMQSQATAGPSSVGQAAVVAALNGPQDFVVDRSKAFEHRRDLVLSMLSQAPGITCARPEGAFYLFPSCAGLIGKTTASGKVIESDTDFVRYLMDEHGVATVQGEAYGLSPHFRISIAASEEELVEACQRIQKACAALK
ncbi:MAG: pyridoxal phosphate-dependent aminotransferase [Hyphomicrobiaceae bacterium]|nr:pyridoxal phosphate-dependent aminotransferase [Hyphomicrobiaceae bacterium]